MRPSKWDWYQSAAFLAGVLAAFIILALTILEELHK